MLHGEYTVQLSLKSLCQRSQQRWQRHTGCSDVASSVNHPNYDQQCRFLNNKFIYNAVVGLFKVRMPKISEKNDKFLLNYSNLF